MSTFAVTDQNDLIPAMNYVLSNLGQGATGNGNITIPANVLVANTTTGNISTYGGTPYGYLYRYISLAYGNSSAGANFSYTPTNRNYFGVYNSTTAPSPQPSDPALYQWAQVSPGFGTTNTIYYATTGGQQIIFVSANSAPSTSYVQSVANTAIDLSVVTTASGAPGERGPIAMAYVLTTSDPNLATNPTLTAWFESPRTGNTAPIGTGLSPPVTGDTAQFTYNNGTTNPTATYTYDSAGAAWNPVNAQVISGNVIIQGTLAGNAIRANTVTATQIATGTLTTDLFTANTINGNIIAGNTLSANTIIAGSFTANTINGNSLIIGTVSNTQIANGTITTTQIANGTITTNDIAANTITANNIAVGANITGSQIAANTITAVNLVANTLTTNTVISTGAVLNSNSSQGFWLDGPSGNARFGNNLSIGNSVTIGTVIAGGSLTANSVGTVQIANGAITSDKLAVGTIIVANSIQSNNAVFGSNTSPGYWLDATTGTSRFGGGINIGNSLIVGSDAQIGGNLNVTGLITSGGLNVNTVGSSQLTSNAVIAGKIADAAVTLGALAASSIQANAIAANTMNANILSTGTLNSNIIYAGNITANQITSGTINSNVIYAGTVSANNITSGTLAANVIYAGTVAATNITAGTLSSNVIYAGNIVSTGATLNNTSSPGYWLAYQTGDARFGGNVSIGNNLTVGNLITSSALNANVVSFNNIVRGTIPTPVGSNYISPNVTVGPGGTNMTETTVNWYDRVLGYTIIPYSPAYATVGPQFVFSFSCNMALTASPSGPSFPYIQLYVKPQYSSGSTAPGATYTGLGNAQYYVSVSSFTGAVIISIRATLPPAYWTSTTSCLVGVAFFASLNGSATATFTTNNWTVT
jgi:hypothetical protein